MNLGGIAEPFKSDKVQQDAKVKRRQWRRMAKWVECSTAS
jgi:hypothetical protein